MAWDDLTEEDWQEVARLLRQAIDGDRYPFIAASQTVEGHAREDRAAGNPRHGAGSDLAVRSGT
jgi:hypothetical protein